MTLVTFSQHGTQHWIGHMISHMSTPHAEQQAQAACIVQINQAAKSATHHMLHTVLFHLIEHRSYFAPQVNS